jgi:hypothetical protein
MESIPWLSFKNLQTFSLAYPHIKHPSNVFEFVREFKVLKKGRSFHVELLMLSAAQLTSLRHDPGCLSLWIHGFAEAEPGKTCIRTERVGLKVSHFPIQFWGDDSDWEKIWACGLHV